MSLFFASSSSLVPGGATSTVRTWRSPAGLVYKILFPSQAEQISWLRLMVEAYRELQSLRSRAVNIVFDVYRLPPKRQAAHALAIGDWVQKHIDFVNELPETFSSPLATLRQGYEDCDGHAVLVATLCETIGIPTQLVALAWPEGRDRSWGYRHIYAQALVPAGRRIYPLPLDSTLRGPVGATNPLRLSIQLHGDVRTLVV